VPFWPKAFSSVTRPSSCQVRSGKGYSRGWPHSPKRPAFHTNVFPARIPSDKSAFRTLTANVRHRCQLQLDREMLTNKSANNESFRAVDEQLGSNPLGGLNVLTVLLVVAAERQVKQRATRSFIEARLG